MIHNNGVFFVYNPENFDPSEVLPAALADLATPARIFVGCVLFARTFPTVFQVLSALRAKDYRRAPLILQSLEATLVVKTVCRRLMRDYPDLPFLTIHDAVLTTEPNAATVRQALTDAFARYGIVPTLKTDTYGEVDTPTGNVYPADYRPLTPLTSSVQRSTYSGAISPEPAPDRPVQKSPGGKERIRVPGDPKCPPKFDQEYGATGCGSYSGRVRGSG